MHLLGNDTSPLKTVIGRGPFSLGNSKVLELKSFFPDPNQMEVDFDYALRTHEKNQIDWYWLMARSRRKQIDWYWWQANSINDWYWFIIFLIENPIDWYWLMAGHFENWLILMAKFHQWWLPKPDINQHFQIRERFWSAVRRAVWGHWVRASGDCK